MNIFYFNVPISENQHFGTTDLSILIIFDLFVVVWMRDLRPIKDDDVRYQFTQSNQKFQLTILNSTHDDTAQYTVCASDTNGETSAAFSLNVFVNTDL